MTDLTTTWTSTLTFGFFGNTQSPMKDKAEIKDNDDVKVALPTSL